MSLLALLLRHCKCCSCCSLQLLLSQQDSSSCCSDLAFHLSTIVADKMSMNGSTPPRSFVLRPKWSTLFLARARETTEKPFCRDLMNFKSCAGHYNRPAGHDNRPAGHDNRPAGHDNRPARPGGPRLLAVYLNLRGSKGDAMRLYKTRRNAHSNSSSSSRSSNNSRSSSSTCVGSPLLKQ